MGSQSFLLKKEIGRSCCDNTTPMATPDASVVSSNGSLKLGSARVRSWAISCFNCVKASWCCSFHTKVGFFKIYVNGEAIWA